MKNAKNPLIIGQNMENCLNGELFFNPRCDLFPYAFVLWRQNYCNSQSDRDTWRYSSKEASKLCLNIYLRQGGNVFAGLCLSVCLCVSKITQKVMDGSFWNFEGMLQMAQTTSDSILGVIRKES